MEHLLSDYYRIPVNRHTCPSRESVWGPEGFFRFGPAAICYGQCEKGPTAQSACALLYDALEDVQLQEGTVRLPFNAAEVIGNLRRERYTTAFSSGQHGVARRAIRGAYYAVRELLPVSVRRYLQRAYFRDWRQLPFPNWPVDCTVDILQEHLLQLSMQSKHVQRVPIIWFWPDGAQSCLVMTHDVETSAGRNFTPQLMDIDDSFGIKSSFQLVPESRYEIPAALVQEIRVRGFEVNIHDLNHDGSLFREHREFLRRAAKINSYVQKYQARGFRSGAMYRNQGWYDAFEFSYDMSVPNVAHLEPQRGGCCTVMPYFVGKIVEIPLTTTQDYSLFHILNDYSIDLWKEQLALIRKKHGLMSFIAHPDYLIPRRARKVYQALLHYVREMTSRDDIWMALPRDVDLWWRARSQMKLVPQKNGWSIEGPEKERARLAYAVFDGGCLRYEFP
jgi:hypothetical protein